MIYRLPDKSRLMLLLIVLVSAVKLILINKGFLAFPDEDRYRAAGQILKSLAHSDFHSALEFLFSTKGRPGDAVVKIIPTVLQYLNAELFGLEVYETANSWPVFAYNFVIYGLLLLLHYKVSLHLLREKFLSLFSVLVFATLVVSYISLRHADPYDASLLILYYVFYNILSAKGITNRRMLFFGFVAFFGYLCYPGYVLLFLALPMFFVIREALEGKWFSGIPQGLFFVSGSVICLLIFEALAQIGGTSFIENSLMLSGTILQGSFSECFSFLFKYLVEAEGINGIFLLTGLGIFLLLFFRNIKKMPAEPICLVFLVLLLLFLVYSAAGYYLHKVVWYARLLKQFFPFLVLFCVFAINASVRHFRLKAYRTAVVFVLSLMLSVSFSFKIYDYKNCFYPKDIAWEFYNKYRFQKTEMVLEYNKSHSFMPNFSIVKKKMPRDHAPELVFVNISGFYPFTDLHDYRKYENPNHYKLLSENPSCLHFKAYQFEGYNIRARENLDAANLQIRVYRKD
ncbi:hypothetical protein [Flavobacterium pallidum]|uniref:Glycosyltransferase RgtA/B/C/D-like domain-containing protein n=1 Tax=Flavobacterium pallidum TaxID=2172098 RepID=A0A2S1SKT5_9FLAO|nr:hypothetical protein [Flavobacterium pallidum]AWI27018.1 hypothetical protein HYN49_14505 [Flavobacterium pallidum]